MNFTYKTKIIYKRWHSIDSLDPKDDIERDLALIGGRDYLKKELAILQKLLGSNGGKPCIPKQEDEYTNSTDFAPNHCQKDFLNMGPVITIYKIKFGPKLRCVEFEVILEQIKQLEDCRFVTTKLV